jgi:adenosylcobinamide kinase/adenosylcobinamide-phosphate guanylyltransferase
MATRLVLGGARSGKTGLAQARAEALAGPLTMIVTAQAFDDEMTARIERHKADRDGRWTTVEAPLDLVEAIRTLAPGDVAVVDCLTLWLSNLMAAGRDIEAARGALVAAVEACPADLWLLSNEVGWGIVPDNALARRFRDEAGFLHQALARVADEAVLVVAGLPLMLKTSGG